MSGAVAHFKFSRLPYEERVARTLSSIIHPADPGMWTVYVEEAKKLIPFVESGFTALPKYVDREEVEEEVEEEVGEDESAV